MHKYIMRDISSIKIAYLSDTIDDDLTPEQEAIEFTEIIDRLSGYASQFESYVAFKRAINDFSEKTIGGQSLLENVRDLTRDIYKA